MEGNVFFFSWEAALMEWLQAHTGKAGELLGILFTYFGEELILVALLGFLYWSYDKKFGRYVGINLLLALVLNPMVKNIFLRRRPYFDHAGIQCLKPVNASADIYNISAQGYSFPSGHSMNAANVYGSIAAYKKKKGITVLACALILLVGLSRILLGVHYPTDVLCGWLLGIGVLWGMDILQKKCKDDRLLCLILIVIGLPGLFYCTSEDYFTCYGLLLGACAGFLFEKKFVNFENTRCPVRAVLRVAGGILVFSGLNYGLKLPFSSALLEANTWTSHMLRLFRYGIVIFADLGVYPMLFAVTAKVGKNKACR